MASCLGESPGLWIMLWSWLMSLLAGYHFLYIYGMQWASPGHFIVDFKDDFSIESLFLSRKGFRIGREDNIVFFFSAEKNKVSVGSFLLKFQHFTEFQWKHTLDGSWHHQPGIQILNALDSALCLRSTYQMVFIHNKTMWSYFGLI